MSYFLSALTLLTTAPVPSRWSLPTSNLGKSLPWFPLIGAILGVILSLGFYFLRFVFSTFISSALVLALWAALTGALHLEGVADSGDGLLSTAPREKRLEIMRDPHVGAFGLIALCIVLIMKFAAIASLRNTVFLALAPIIARWAMVLAAAFPLARTEGMAARFSDGLSRRGTLIATLFTALCAAALGARGVIAWVAATLVVLVLARIAQSRVGGMTGDVYGAVGELTEIAVLMVGQ
jgi:adenosylcobinamide-GDP ribazoletransferase